MTWSSKEIFFSLSLCHNPSDPEPTDWQLVVLNISGYQCFLSSWYFLKPVCFFFPLHRHLWRFLQIIYGNFSHLFFYAYWDQMNSTTQFVLPMYLDNSIKNKALLFFVATTNIFIQQTLMSLLVRTEFSSVAQSCLTLCDPMNCSTPGLPVPSPTPGAYSNSCPPSRWYHPAISSSVDTIHLRSGQC